MDEIRKAKEKLGVLAEAQGGSLREVIGILESAERDPAVVELARLKAERDELRKSLDERTIRVKALETEASLARHALREQLVDEKLSALRLSKNKTDAYFSAAGKAGAASLSGLEAKAKARAKALEARAKEGLAADAEGVLADLDALERRVEALAADRRAGLAAEEKRLREEAEAARAGLAEIPVDEEVIAERAKRNRLEMKVGAGLLGKLGISLVVIAAALFGYYARDMINAYAKGALIFLGGALLVCVGEILYRKKKAPLHELFLGGGIAVLYLAAFLSHFVLKQGGQAILGVFPALAVCVGITAASVLLSLRYASRTIFSISAIGGYLPFAAFLAAFGFSGTQHYYAMGYLLLLNLLVLGVGLAKDWPIASYILFGIGTPSISFLVLDAPSPLIGIGCVAIAFGTFLANVFLRSLIKKRGMRAMDLVLLGLNTSISSLLVYLLFDKLGWSDRFGVLSIGFAAVYLIAGFLSRFTKTKDVKPAAIFFLTALAFAALAVPFQFGAVWMSLGWLVEAVILIVFGYRLRIRIAEISGWVLLCLCAGAFIVLDIPLQFEGFVYSYLLESPPLFGVIPMFGMKYLALSAALVALALFFGVERARGRLSPVSARGKGARALASVACVNVALFSLYAAPTWLHILAREAKGFGRFFPYDRLTVIIVAAIALSFRLASSLARRTSIATDKAARWVGYILLLIGDAVVGFATLDPWLIALGFDYPLAAKVVSAALLLALNAGLLLDARFFFSRVFRKSGRDAELYPLFTALVATECVIALVLCHVYGVPEDIVLAVSLFALALACIAIGFRRSFTYIRFLGLALIGVSMVILFFSVFRETDVGGKIIAFLSLGLALIGVSWGYGQIDKKLKRRIAGNAEGEHNDEA